MALPWWQHHKHYYYYYNQILQKYGKWAAIGKLSFWFLDSFGGGRKVLKSHCRYGYSFTEYIMATKRIYSSKNKAVWFWPDNFSVKGRMGSLVHFSDSRILLNRERLSSYCSFLSLRCATFLLCYKYNTNITLYLLNLKRPWNMGKSVL